ncbi:ESX secretion-associated protein EspG [Allosaccharopolyspora coralli]|uniref:ESX secretion-associated protein EspG n=1 Tax=Allosaccharopolyspora coralli TaxID=2665642 RepID=A0A5Q3QKJ2_9PSEU|nr:ESX secretion-associated protein EspG [Allosaccharopolyspora coralli]QGK71347.1 ESX secretion-associated protein EspG [Allosaccharopolyspora coralli]
MMLDTATDHHRPVELSALELDVVWEHLALGTLPLVIKVPSPGRTHQERSELVETVWNGLSARGLGDRGGLDADLEAMLRVLAEPHREVDGRLWLGRGVRVLAASAHAEDANFGVPAPGAVLAVKDGDVITMRAIAAAGLAREATGVLPPLPAGSGGSVTLRGADLDAAAAESGDDPERLRSALRGRGVRPDDVETLARMTTEVRGQGQFGAARREPGARRVRAERVVGFFDTPHGRYLQMRRDSASGDPWSTVAPVDARTLISHVEALHADLEA